MHAQPLTDAQRREAQEGAEAILRGELVAFPTETVYGLGADATNEAAVREVFARKGRPSNNPLIVHVADEAGARSVCASWPDRASALAQAFWPGPLTLVLPRAPRIPSIVAGGGDTVAVRCPDHPLALALLRECGRPLVGPSANLSGSVSPTTADHVREAFPDIRVLDGGPCRVGIESTVVSLAEDRARLLRSGAVSLAQIEASLSEPVDDATLAHAGADPLPSPGMFSKHYAPRARTLLIVPEDLHAALLDAPDDAILLTKDRPMPTLRSRVSILRLPENAEDYARLLYAALRDADARSPGLIIVEEPQEHGPLWDAIRDRLRRAAASE